MSERCGGSARYSGRTRPDARGGRPAVVFLEGLDGEGLLAPFQDASGCGSSGRDGSDKGDLVLVGSPTYPCTVSSRAAAPGGVHDQLHLDVYKRQPQR